MIAGWTDASVVVSRIFRNCKGIDAIFNDSIEEWIPEAILKLKTIYSVEPKCCPVQIEQYQGKLPCKQEGILTVLSSGRRLTYNLNGNRYGHNPHYKEGLLFKSVNPIYTTAGDLSDGDTGRSKFPRDVIVALEAPCDEVGWYSIQGRYIQTSIQCGELTIVMEDIPRNENGYPLVPTSEFMQTAIYYYCRMMLIEAGYDDKVFSYQAIETKWNNAALIAINDATYPTPDQVEDSIHKHLDNFFPY